jgi:hypothetical protein
MIAESSRQMDGEAMSKTQTTLMVDERLLREAERMARARQKTLDQLVEEALRREVQAPSAPERRPVKLPTHGRGGLLPGVDLEDKELMDRLLSEP